MTRRATLPSLAHVRTAITELEKTSGKPPTVLALARHLRLANTTFRRHFPDVAIELNRQRIEGCTGSGSEGISRFEQLIRDNDKLRRDNHELTAHLDLAVASIQRLALDNERLRRALDATSTVTRIDSSSTRR